MADIKYVVSSGGGSGSIVCETIDEIGEAVVTLLTRFSFDIVNVEILRYVTQTRGRNDNL